MNFKEIFDKSKNAPGDGFYKGKHIFCSDKFPVKNKDILLFCIEKTNSKYPQGFAIRCEGSLKIGNKRHQMGKYGTMLFWEDSEVLDPKHIEVQVFSKYGFVYIKNIWEQHSIFKGEKVAAYVGSSDWMRNQVNGAAMYAEEIEGGRRYFCNDGDEDDDFDDIVFTVKNLGQPKK